MAASQNKLIAQTRNSKRASFHQQEILFERNTHTQHLTLTVAAILTTT